MTARASINPSTGRHRKLHHNAPSSKSILSETLDVHEGNHNTLPSRPRSLPSGRSRSSTGSFLSTSVCIGTCKCSSLDILVLLRRLQHIRYFTHFPFLSLLRAPLHRYPNTSYDKPLTTERSFYHTTTIIRYNCHGTSSSGFYWPSPWT